MLQQHAHCAWATAIIKLITFVAHVACWVCLCCHNPPNSDMDYTIFIVRTDVNACDCTQGCTDTCKVCKDFTESWLWEENPLRHWGIEPASAAWQSDALNHLSYIPTPLRNPFTQTRVKKSRTGRKWMQYWMSQAQQASVVVYVCGCVIVCGLCHMKHIFTFMEKYESS